MPYTPRRCVWLSCSFPRSLSFIKQICSGSCWLQLNGSPLTGFSGLRSSPGPSPTDGSTSCSKWGRQLCCSASFYHAVERTILGSLICSYVPPTIQFLRDLLMFFKSKKVLSTVTTATPDNSGNTDGSIYPDWGCTGLTIARLILAWRWSVPHGLIVTSEKLWSICSNSPEFWEQILGLVVICRSSQCSYGTEQQAVVGAALAETQVSGPGFSGQPDLAGQPWPWQGGWN